LKTFDEGYASGYGQAKADAISMLRTQLAITAQARGADIEDAQDPKAAKARLTEIECALRWVLVSLKHTLKPDR
jgi:hypothetical protein